MKRTLTITIEFDTTDDCFDEANAAAELEMFTYDLEHNLADDWEASGYGTLISEVTVKGGE